MCYAGGVPPKGANRTQNQKRNEFAMKILTITGEEAGNIRDTLNQPGTYKHNLGLVNSLLLQVIDDNDGVHEFSLENTTVYVERPSCYGFEHGEVIESVMDFDRWEFTSCNGDGEPELTLHKTPVC